jgi:tRNA-Thr(GGU) m(6)t(6)A37 methyltransferase TsaA
VSKALRPVELGEHFNMSIKMEPIAIVHTDAKELPRQWKVSDVEGTLVIDDRYLEGVKDIEAGQRIVVIFHFHRSPAFDASYLTQKPHHRKKRLGVFSIRSPIRPNPIGVSVLEVLEVKDNIIRVKGVDMLDGTPVLDIKPHIDG